MDCYDVIKKPLVTEKVMASKEGAVNLYAFAVNLKADKKAIREAVEALFKVHVEKVNTAVIRGKEKRVGRSIGRKSNWKKALVTLKQGDKIEIFEGV